MSDITLKQTDQLPSSTSFKYKDMGDGTFALIGAAVLLSNDDTFLAADDTTGALKTIDTVHGEVHEGEVFHAEYSASVNNNASLDLRILVGAGGCHTAFLVTTGGATTMYLYEAPTIEGGTGVTAYNFKRDDTTHAAPFQCWHSPTVSATGTVALIPGRLLPGGASPQTRVGAESRPGLEWILKAGTEYLFRLTNTSGTAVTISAGVDGYEA